MRFEVLTGVAVRPDEETTGPAGPASATQQRLLGALLAAEGARVDVDRLVDVVWDDDAPPSAISSLRAHASRLRRLVGDRLRGEGGGYVLTLAPGDRYDAAELADVVGLLRAARAATQAGEPVTVDAEVVELAERLVKATPTPFGDVGDHPFVVPVAVRIAADRDGTLELLAALDLAAGRPTAAVRRLEPLVAARPLHEAAWVLLVEATVQAGRPGEAVRIAARARDALADAGLVPGRALVDAEQTALGVGDDGAGDRTAAGTRTTRVLRRPRPMRPLGSFVGRDEDLAVLTDAASRHRVVTVVGPGGVGKTRLVAEWAARRGAEDAVVVVVDLSGLRTASEVADVVAAAVSPGDGRGSESVVDVLAAASDHVDVVVLDNVEHVVAGVADVVPLLVGHGDLVVVATGREPIGLSGERVIVLAPLSAGPDGHAVALFRERTLEAGSTSTPDPVRSAQICARLDGLPLAIEMAAVRLRASSLDDLERELDDDLAALDANRRDLPERQRSLWALLDWSFRLLDAAETAALEALATFAGPVVAADVADLLDRPEDRRDVDRILRGLVDRSLVVVPPDGPGRYGLLHVVRDHVRGRLAEADRLDELDGRHARWVAGVVRQVDAALRTEAEGEAQERFADLVPEVRRAVGWAVEHDHALVVELLGDACLAAQMSLCTEAATWADVAQAAVPGHHVGRDVLDAVSAVTSTIVGRLDDAVRFGTRSMDAAPHGHRACDAAGALGDATSYLGRLEEAEGWFRVAAAEADRVGDQAHVPLATAGLAIALAYQGRVDEALAAVEAVVATTPSGRGWRAYARGESLLELDPDAAAVHLDEAVGEAASAGNRFLHGVASLSAVTSASRSRDPRSAAQRMSDLLAVYRDVGERKHLLTTLRNVVPLLVALGRDAEAVEIAGLLAAHPGAPTFGPERERLDDAVEMARVRLDPGVLDGALGRVATLGPGALLDAAAEIATVALAASSPGPDGVAETDAERPVGPVVGPVNAVAARPSTAEEGRFVAAGSVWQVSYRGTTVLVEDRKGVRDLVVLLARPDVEVHALDLVGDPDRSDAAGPLVDDTAKAAYQRRIGILREDIATARDRGDVAAAERAEDELDALVAQLAAAFGLGGRPRPTGAPFERARSTVTQRVRAAIRRIADLHPDLGRHLRASVRTGTWCVYTPEHSHHWYVEQRRD